MYYLSIIKTGMMAFVLALISSCGMMDNNPVGFESIEFVKFIPQDGSQDAPTDGVIRLEFANNVDPQIIERNFVLISKNALNDAACDEGKNPVHLDMGRAMKNMDMMRHLAVEHSTKGEFLWNQDSTVCEFLPDEELESDCEYMMFADEDMLAHMRDRMDMMRGIGGMMGGMNLKLSDCPCHQNGSNNTMIVHFRTGNTNNRDI